MEIPKMFETVSGIQRALLLVIMFVLSFTIRKNYFIVIGCQNRNVPKANFKGRY